MSYKPEEAVMLIVWTSGGALLHSTLSDTIRPIGSESELNYIKANLSARKIPWDETNAANDDISGFGQRTDRLSDKLVEQVADAVWAKLITSKVGGNDLTASEMLAYVDEHTYQTVTRETK